MEIRNIYRKDEGKPETNWNIFWQAIAAIIFAILAFGYALGYI